VRPDTAATAFASRQVVSGRFPSGHSACLTDVGSQGKCRPDDKCHGISLLDEECQRICLLNVVRVIQTQNVKANVFRMIHAMASGFQISRVRAFAFRTQRVSYRRRMSRQISSRRRVSRQMSNGRRVPWHLPSGQGVSSPSLCSTSYRCTVSRQMGSRQGLRWCTTHR